MPIKFSKETSTRLFRYVKSIDIRFNRKYLSSCYAICSFFQLIVMHQHRFPAFDSRTRSTREIWRQMQAKRFHDANPKLKINTDVSSSPDPPQIVFTFVDDSKVRTVELGYFLKSWSECCCPPNSLLFQKVFDSQSYKADEILFDVHLTLHGLDNEYEMAGKSLDD